MSIIDRFLKPLKKGADAKTAAERIERLRGALGNIEQERAKKAEAIAAHAEERRRLLLDEAPAETILAHDVETDRAKISVEGLDEATRKIVAMIAFEEDVIAEEKWREYYSTWHPLALALLEAMRAAHAAQQKFLAHHESATGEYCQALQLGRVPVVNPGGLLELDQIHVKERRRREAMDAVIARMRAEETI
jgi:hypothetical protein